LSSAMSMRPVRYGMYGLAVLLLGFEFVVLWLVLHPNVSDDYRAYYITQTTTCLNQPVPGTYSFGTVVSFRPDGREAAKPVRVCGWEGPAGDGTHAVGTSARLRFDPKERPNHMALTLEMIAITKDGVPTQRVDVQLDGTSIGTVEVDTLAAGHFVLPVPDALVKQVGPYEVTLGFPDAVQMGPTDPDSRRRSIKLIAAGLVPA
jgi:hypothetical protein